MTLRPSILCIALASVLLFLDLQSAHSAPAIDPKQAVVHIQIFQRVGSTELQIGEASGFLISATGWVITAKHVTEPRISSGAMVVFRGSAGARDGTHYPLTLRMKHQGSDIALLQFEPGVRRDWPYLAVVRNPIYAPDTEITAFGFPAMLNIETRPGKITSVQNDGTVGVNVGLYKGMSGGPVVDAAARVIGVIHGGLNNNSFDYFTPSQPAYSLFEQGHATFLDAGPPPPGKEFTVDYMRLDSVSYIALFGAGSGNAEQKDQLFGGPTRLIPNEVDQQFNDLLKNFGTNVDPAVWDSGGGIWEIGQEEAQRVQIARPTRILEPVGNLWYPDPAVTRALLTTKDWPAGFNFVPHSFWKCGEIGALRPPILWRPIRHGELTPEIYRRNMDAFIAQFAASDAPGKIPRSLQRDRASIAQQDTEAETRLRLYAKLAGDRWPDTLLQAQIGLGVHCSSGNWFTRLTNLNIWMTVAAIRVRKSPDGRMAQVLIDALGGTLAPAGGLRPAQQAVPGAPSSRRMQREIFANGAVVVVPMKMELFRVPPPGSAGPGSGISWLESWTEKGNQFEGNAGDASTSTAKLRSMTKPDGTIDFPTSTGGVWLTKTAAPMVAPAPRREPGRFTYGPSFLPQTIKLDSGAEVLLRKFDPDIQLVSLTTFGVMVSQCPNLYVKRGSAKTFSKMRPILRDASSETLRRTETVVLGPGVTEVQLFEEEGETTYLEEFIVFGRPHGSHRFHRVAESYPRRLNYGDSVSVSIPSSEKYDALVLRARGYYVPYGDLVAANARD